MIEVVTLTDLYLANAMSLRTFIYNAGSIGSQAKWKSRWIFLTMPIDKFPEIAKMYINRCAIATFIANTRSGAAVIHFCPSEIRKQTCLHEIRNKFSTVVPSGCRFKITMHLLPIVFIISMFTLYILRIVLLKWEWNLFSNGWIL